MTYELNVLIFTAVSIAFFHTILGPDHYIPFVAMSRSGKWTLGKTVIVTVCCGLAHVISSVILGIAGIALGLTVNSIKIFDGYRGDIASYGLIAFGLCYFAWGVKKALKDKSHIHLHSHGDGNVHIHAHSHKNDHMHIHKEKKNKNTSPWVLFSIFLFGPCEPLMPLLMYPASKSSLKGLIVVTATFGAITVVTMLLVVLISIYGVSFFSTGRIERFTHALSGISVFLCGISIKFLGL